MFKSVEALLTDDPLMAFGLDFPDDPGFFVSSSSLDVESLWMELIVVPENENGERKKLKCKIFFKYKLLITQTDRVAASAQNAK